MQGFFRANGSCGYVKKPEFLLNAGPYGVVFNPNADLPVEKTLKVIHYYRKCYGSYNFHFVILTFSDSSSLK